MNKRKFQIPMNLVKNKTTPVKQFEVGLCGS